MAKALKCDVCGGLFEYDPSIPNTIEHYYVNALGTCSNHNCKQFNCCPGCYGEIIKVIEEREKLKEVKDEPADN